MTVAGIKYLYRETDFYKNSDQLISPFKKKSTITK
jgi:hypothetical protein